ncbi:hypothetical protein [Endozoicomonas ascidiicola]|uniref:hypothetical protein n=1 Tax=Endozoicomonas ascidiicola TaxID=1698521 RepID=UPI0008314C34|nr:hypothetical protein [Endozoicomonas ascidiicola]
MKRFHNYSLAIFSLLISVLSFSILAAPQPSLLSALPASLSGEGDQLNINLSDKTEIEREYIKYFYLRGERDSDLLLSTIDRLHHSVRELTNITSELEKMSDEANFQPVPINDFLGRIRAYKQEAALFMDDVETLEHYPTLRDDVTITVDSQVDLRPLADHYRMTVSNLNHRTAALPFNIILPNGIFHQQTGIDNSQLKGMTLFTSQQIADMKRNVMQLRAMRTEDKRVIDEGINRFTKNALETYVDSFGRSDRYRTGHDDEGRARAKDMLIEAFWARSYIRATYGIQIGAIPVEYSKRIFNLDFYLSDMTIGANPTYDQNKLTHYANLAKEALTTFEQERAVSKKWASVSAWLTWVSGRGNEYDTKYFILALIKKDIEEELALSRSGGLRVVRNGYRRHYLATDQERRIFEGKARQVFGHYPDSHIADNDTIDEDIDDEDIEEDVAMIEAGTLKGSIALSINALENQENRLEEAKKLQGVIDLLSRDNSTALRRKKRQAF